MDILSRTPPIADRRISYGPGESQFGDLWLPAVVSTGRLPLVVFLHGGWWQSAFGLGYAGPLCAALKAEGIAVWSVEYRRVGRTGGGWPTTFQDAAAGFDYVSELTKSYPLDLSRVIVAGHSAGGHLAFWLAGRHHIDPRSLLYEPQPKVRLRGVVALAGAVDLRMTIDLSGSLTYAHDKREVYSLMSGPPEQFDDRYRAGNPGDLLPLGVRQALVQGTDDAQVPPLMAARWAAKARQQGDEVTVHMVPGAGHLDVIDPLSKAWPTVLAAIRSMLL